MRFAARCGSYGQFAQHFTHRRITFHVLLQKHPDCRPQGGAGRDDFFPELVGVLRHEMAGGKGDLVDRSECPAEVDSAVAIAPSPITPAEMAAETGHDLHVGTGKTIDRLPVVAYGKNFCARVLLLQGIDEPCPTLGNILKFIDQNVPKRALILATLN